MGDRKEVESSPEVNVAQINVVDAEEGDFDDEALDDAYWKAFNTAEERVMRRVKRAHVETTAA